MALGDLKQACSQLDINCALETKPGMLSWMSYVFDAPNPVGFDRVTGVVIFSSDASSDMVGLVNVLKRLPHLRKIEFLLFHPDRETLRRLKLLMPDVDVIGPSGEPL